VFKCFTLFSPLLLLWIMPQPSPQTAPQPATPAEFKVPPEIAQKANPVKPTPEGLAHAKKMYGYDCAMCHGANGDGKGDLVADMKLKLRDYRDPSALKDLTDGELFYIIQKGKDQMPPEGDRAKEEDIWNLVSVVRSFSRQ
jgi:mono/diheme cytochrome c family protein